MPAQTLHAEDEARFACHRSASALEQGDRIAIKRYTDIAAGWSETLD